MATEEQLRQEVEEVTTLLRNDAAFAELRDLLADHGLVPSETVLAGLIDGEDESMYGVFLTVDLQCIRFEARGNGELIEWRNIDDLSILANAFEAVDVGVAMLQAGEIR